VEQVATMPRNTIGKIDKKALRDPYWEGRRKV
jgi:non-ribosomal peptide synthetase component E (peptide arylation enzyme)